MLCLHRAGTETSCTRCFMQSLPTLVLVLPIQKAVAAIRRLESFKRGWYCGPIGYFGFDCAEFAVGIRSGLIHDKKLFLFAGAGIVADSQPEAEWEEIETKIGNFIEIFQNGK